MLLLIIIIWKYFLIILPLINDEPPWEIVPCQIYIYIYILKAPLKADYIYSNIYWKKCTIYKILKRQHGKSETSSSMQHADSEINF